MYCTVSGTPAAAAEGDIQTLRRYNTCADVQPGAVTVEPADASTCCLLVTADHAPVLSEHCYLPHGVTSGSLVPVLTLKNAHTGPFNLQAQAAPAWPEPFSNSRPALAHHV